MRFSSVRNVDRMRHITEIAVRHGFGYFFERHNLRNLMPHIRREAKRPTGNRGVHIRNMLEEMGPTFIKFGQLLSTRPDILPEDILVELRKLQDEVRAFPVRQAYETIESELKLTVERLFIEFEDTPIAAASIGQVHRAVLPNGDRVIVKVQRPDAEALVKADIDLLYQFAHLLSDHTRQEIMVDPVGVVDQFARGIRSELDYRIEARNAERFAQLFDLDPSVAIPKVYWGYSTTRVLTLEYLEGTQVADLDPEAMTMAERKAVASIIAECWLKQIFLFGFFHGDPHPANILVMEDGTIGLVDFGIAGRLTPDDRQNIISLFIDVTNQKVENIPRRLAALGVDFPHEMEAEFINELRDLFAKYYGIRLSDLDPVVVFRDIFGTIYRLKLKLPAQFLLLDKSVATLEGITTQIYPSFNVLEFARPYAREFVSDRYSPASLVERGSHELQKYLDMMLQLPYQLHDTLEQVRQGEVKINFVHRNLEDLSSRLTVLANRLVVAIVLASLILGSSVIGLFVTGGPRLLGISLFALFGFTISAFFGLWLVGGILRSGRH
ncbi:MAG: AarF/ABC1/UbiB kinase family protein [Actinomycetota bacterium]|nr:AarF/ABC1/UbiB kinase family protein [Actinomycetota bacterium]MDA8166672.1 AarF/ABC1/UbiB kinase family protein [Actinomycetota bacterium]